MLNEQDENVIVNKDKPIAEWLKMIASQHPQFSALSQPMFDRLEKVAKLLVEWNEKINLTTVTDNEGIVIKHFLDSLTLLPWLEQKPHAERKKPENRTLIDVGTGAGFPGLVIKIVRPDIDVCLVDAQLKKVSYLKEIITQLSLEGITVVHARAEDLGRDRAFREQFDFATARAVASLPVLCEYCLPLVRVGGSFLAMKTDIDHEWPAASRAVRLLGGRAGHFQTFFLPGTEIRRAILEFVKDQPTPDRFPRKAGKPRQHPL